MKIKLKHRKMSIQNKAGMMLAPLSVALFILLVVSSMIKGAPRTAMAAGRTGPADTPARLVVLLTTGDEDGRTLDLALRYAVAAKRSGYFKDVSIVADGRGVEALADGLEPRSQETTDLEKDAKGAGVRLIVSASGLRQAGVGADRLRPKPDEIVSDGATKIAALIAQHYGVIRF